MKNKPVYSIDSVDHALRLAVLLKQEGPLRVTEAADRLGVARSTAHRLLAMLVYRDFAEQDADRCYRAGPVLREAATEGIPVTGLRAAALPHLRALVGRCGETVNLIVLVGTGARFVASAECSNILRVGDREGRTLPAHLASGGVVLLAALPEEELLTRYADSTVDLQRLRRELRRVRRQGFAVNDQRTETGVTAIGRAVRDHTGAAVAAVSIAMPTARYRRDHLEQWTTQLTNTTAHIEGDLDARLG